MTYASSQNDLKNLAFTAHRFLIMHNFDKKAMPNKEIATLANGCFWCADAVYRQVKGVLEVKSGFTGGTIKNPAYREVVRELTGHAEAVQLTFDPAVISYREILLIFFTIHDPTSLNRQGYDVGSHYRSVIFYHNEKQKQIAEEIIDELNRSTFDHKIVTEINKAQEFYEAEEYHQDFYRRNTTYPYCQVIINPKLNKLRQHFADKLISSKMG